MGRLTTAFVVMGISCSISQILLVREFMIIFYGNEFILGVIFFNWLLCIALGSWLSGRLVDGLRGAGWLALAFSLTSIIIPLQIILLRALSGWLALVRGEMAGLPSALSASLLALLPFCSIHGFQFVIGCRVYAERERSPIGKVYMLDAAGAVLGGLLFTFLLVHHLSVLEICSGLSLLNLLTAGLLLHGQSLPRVRGLPPLIFILLTVFGVLGLALEARRVDEASYRWIWGGLHLLHHENSAYGNIAVTRRDGQLDFWINGMPLFTSQDPDVAYVEDIIHLPLLQHPSPERVLLLGEGLGGALREVLKHPVKEVFYIELDSTVVEVSKRYSKEASEILEEPRVKVIYTDGRLYTKESSKLFDVIIVNLPPPSTLQLNRFYTLEFFDEIRRILDVRGVLSTVLPSSPAYIVEEMADRNRCIYNAIKMAFPSLLALPGDHNLFLASPSEGVGIPTSDIQTLYSRLLERGVESRIFNERYLTYRFDPERARIGLAYLSPGDGEANMDVRPLAVYYELALWNAMMHPPLRGLFKAFEVFDLRWLLFPPALSAVALAVGRGRPRIFHRAIPLAVFTTGLAGMTFNIIILYSYQILCGSLYQEVGVVSTSFMLGLASGGWYMGRRISRTGGEASKLAWIEGGVIIHSLILPLILNLFLSRFQPLLPSVRVVLPALNCASGFLVGLMFPLAGRVSLGRYHHAGRVAGSLYASDLLGGCSGSLASSIWLVPFHGIQGACLAVAALNSASLILIRSVREGRG